METADTATETTDTADKKAHGQAGLHRTSMVWLDPDDLVIVGIDTPHKNRAEHYLWDKRINTPLIEADILNVYTYGVKVPALVERDGDKYLVVDGRGRVRRAREAKKRQLAAGVTPTIKVPCVPQRGDELKLAMVSRVANSGRTVDTAIDNAEFAQSLLDQGATESDVAIAFGVKVNTLKEWLVLPSLSSKVKGAITKGLLSASAAAPLAKLSREDQETHLAELIATGAKPSAEKVDNHVRNAQGKPNANTPKNRVEKATDLLAKFAVDYPDVYRATKDEMATLIDKLSTAITGKTIVKLAAAE